VFLFLSHCPLFFVLSLHGMQAWRSPGFRHSTTLVTEIFSVGSRWAFSNALDIPMILTYSHSWISYLPPWDAWGSGVAIWHLAVSGMWEFADVVLVCFEWATPIARNFCPSHIQTQVVCVHRKEAQRDGGLRLPERWYAKTLFNVDCWFCLHLLNVGNSSAYSNLCVGCMCVQIACMTGPLVSAAWAQVREQFALFF